MLLKRSIILAACVLLFIVSFVIYIEVSKFQMEDRFRQEREKYHLDRLAFTAASSARAAASAPAPATDTNALIGPVPPSSSTPDSSAPVPPSTATPDSSTPAAPSSATPDSSAPATPSAATPDSSTPTPAPAPAPTPAPAPDMPSSTPAPVPAGDTNSAPSAPAPSTMEYARSPFFQLASFRPVDVAQLPVVLNVTQTATPASTPAPAAAAPAPETTPTAPEAASPPSGGEASVIVLLYHQFVPAGVKLSPKLQWTLNQDVFESEMKYIHDNGYHVVPMSDVIRFIKHEITLPPGSVCITIDDGYKSAIVYAAPILKKYGYPWTFFIYPSFITVAEGKGAASWNDLLQLQSEGVDIECHSMTHPRLTSHGSKTPEQYAAWLNNETVNSKAILEKHMGKPITSFAYPYGLYNKQVEAAVIAAGYESIFTVADNPVHSTTDLHSIGRYTITQNVVKNFPAYLRQSALGLTKADPEPGATVSDPRPVITAVLDPMGASKVDPQSLETSVRDFGVVKHDFDPQTNTVRLYLPRDLIQPVVLVNIRVKDATTGQVMVANWHFNYEPGNGATSHQPIAPATTATPGNAPALEKDAAGSPLDAHPAETH